MTRNAMPHFDSFDPEVLEAARDVAARAGVPLETWIASVVPEPTGAGARRTRRRPRQEAPPRTEPRRDEGEAPRAFQPEPPPPAQTEAGRDASRETDRDAAADGQPPGFVALMNRLDGIDRAMEADRRAAQAAEGRRLEEIEARIDHALKGAPAQQMTERLGEIERRVLQLGDQFTASRPPGRRGRPAAEEVRDAVQEIRQRRRELAGAQPEGGVVADMRRDLARRLEGAEDGISATVAELQGETARLREAIDRLATSRDVGALEKAVVSLATGVERARAGTDLSAIAGPIEGIRAQVERLAEEVAENVHARVMADVQRLAGRLDSVAAGTADPDRPALSSLFGELDEIRGLVGGLAGPERIQGLAQGLQAVSAQIAQLQSGTDASLRPILEEIRSDVKGAGPVVLAEQIQKLVGKVDDLYARADRMERPGRPGGDVSADMASIHTMLASLAEKVDRFGHRGGGDGLDALERQVLTLADRIEAPRSADPALVGLERTMDDLLAQVAALRETTPDEAALERAARNAVAQTLGGTGVAAADLGEIGLLRASLADMQNRQMAADQRLGATLEGVQSALDRLVSRLGPADAAALRGASLDERLMASTSSEASSAGRRAGREPAVELPRLGDALLEPGAARPAREPAEPAPRELTARRGTRERPRDAGPEGDIKTSFIAAARRAAQAAQAELAAEAPLERRDGRARVGLPGLAAAEGRLGRLRAEFDRRRRPLLLGLAAIVLALGALQAISMRGADEAPRPTSVAQAPTREAPAAPARTEAAQGDATSAKPAVTDPATTQALPGPLPAEARPAPVKGGVPHVSGMNSVQADLGNIPPGLAKVKQAALDGDGAAVWELASREADGRGMPRDLAVAAKLYEKLAAAGFAPAQYKLAGHYEKGSGVVRDLAQAKLWYGRAAEQGHARAMHNLAVLYAENPAANGKPDFASAASWFRQGAEYGIRDSQYNLAVLYARGLGLTQDLVQSYAWFTAAAAQGDDDAGKKRDDVANKLSPEDLANAKTVAATFKPRRAEPAVNEPPAIRDASPAPMSLLGAPAPSSKGFTPPATRTM